MIRARIHVTLKSGFLDKRDHSTIVGDPGFSSVNNVRVGKFLEIELNQDDPAQAEEQLRAMCETLLANTVIEEYRYELELQPSRPPS